MGDRYESHQNFGGGNTFGSHSNFGSGDQDNSNSGTQYFGTQPPAAPPTPAPPASVPGQATPGGAAEPSAPGTPSADVRRNVFVVHGRDEEVRLKMFDLLRLLDLRPLEWEDLVRATGKTAPFLGEVVAKAPELAQAAMVLLTPDDVVQLHPALRGPYEPPYETEPTGQPRPNVLIELGMVLMAYPERTLMVEVGRMRSIADIAGRNVIRFDGTDTALGKIVERLKLAGCTVNDTGSDWRHTAPYRYLAAYDRVPPAAPPAR
ncbi:nucleotide-binding protein [Streptomyces sp. XM83C]|uniref:TIR domain-containing protein n=1 Tax=Streptomyces thermocoprophilus TaxID=78356 RepID=A0ABV5VIA9_9ACTN|nr:nucleotide-binding protein [Streptomyces sp. XM83C]MCK1820921.1 nucleotide-binding protein [Streptomyces sp. XM83C]